MPEGSKRKGSKLHNSWNVWSDTLSKTHCQVNPRTLLPAFLVVCLSALACGTSIRLPVWRDNIALFSATVRDAPGTPFRPRRCLMGALSDAGRHAEAGRIAAELSLLAEQSPLYNRGMIHYNQNNLEAAASDFLASLDTAPRPRTFMIPGMLYRKTGQIRRAENIYRAGLRAFPDDPELRRQFERVMR